MVEKYSVGFCSSARDNSVALIDRRRQDDHAIILTGSTSGLGSYSLSSLLQRGNVSVKTGFEGRGLDIIFLQSEKPVHAETDTFHDDPSLDEQLYQKIRASVTGTVIITTSNEGNAEFLDLALSSPRHPKPGFVFTASTLTAQGRCGANGPFSEEVEYDARIVAEGPGYATSKYVCERISKLPAKN